jgi:hydrogenase/urease accessory protein HupE
MEKTIIDATLYLGACILMAPHLPWYFAVPLALYAIYKIGTP